MTVPSMHGSRSGNSFEFIIEFNEEEYNKAISLLVEWKNMYQQDALPERPKEWLWTQEPCKYCAVKKLCKQDLKDQTWTMSDSCAVGYAKSIDKKYDFKALKERTIKRWQPKSKNKQ